VGVTVIIVAVIMIAAAVGMLMIMGMIVAAFGMIVIVRVIVSAAALLMAVLVFVLVAVIMSAAALFVCMAVVVIVVIMRVIVTFAADVLGIHGEEIEESQHAEADASGQHHRTKDAIRWQVGHDAAGDVEKEHHSAPKQEGGDAEQVKESASAGHSEEEVRSGGAIWWRDFE